MKKSKNNDDKIRLARMDVIRLIVKIRRRVLGSDFGEKLAKFTEIIDGIPRLDIAAIAVIVAKMN